MWKTGNQRAVVQDLLYTSGFGPRVRARALRAPVFLGSLTHQRGVARPPPPIAASLLPQKLKINYFQKQNASLQAQGRISFHCAKLHLTELYCTLPSYMHSSELRGTLLSFAAP